MNRINIGMADSKVGNASQKMTSQRSHATISIIADQSILFDRIQII